MDRYKYYHRETTPLTFHRFINYISLPWGTIATIAEILELFSQRQNYLPGWFEMLVAGDVIYVIAAVIAIIGLLQWASYGWYMLFVTLLIRIAYAVLGIVLTANAHLPITGELLGQLLGTLIFSGIVMIYYYHRKPLFCDVIMENTKKSKRDIVDIIHKLFAFIVFPVLSLDSFFSLIQMIMQSQLYSKSWLIYGILSNIVLGTLSLIASIGLIKRRSFGWYAICARSVLEILMEICTLAYAVAADSPSISSRVSGLILSAVLAFIAILFYAINKGSIFYDKQVQERDVETDLFSSPAVYTDTNYFSNSVPSDTGLKKPAEKVMFCRKCGARLLKDSLFCNKCGTRVK